MIMGRGANARLRRIEQHRPSPPRSRGPQRSRRHPRSRSAPRLHSQGNRTVEPKSPPAPRRSCRRSTSMLSHRPSAPRRRITGRRRARSYLRTLLGACPRSRMHQPRQNAKRRPTRHEPRLPRRQSALRRLSPTAQPRPAPDADRPWDQAERPGSGARAGSGAAPSPVGKGPPAASRPPVTTRPPAAPRTPAPPRSPAAGRTKPQTKRRSAKARRPFSAVRIVTAVAVVVVAAALVAFMLSSSPRTSHRPDSVVACGRKRPIQASGRLGRPAGQP